jgi:hypothetical protein
VTASVQDDRRTGSGRRSLTVWAGAAALMALPVIAIRSVDGAESDPGDFVFLLILLVGVGGAYELATRVPERAAYGAGIALALAAALLSGWINLAVGIIGSEDNPANWVFAAPPAAALLGALMSRFRAAGMAGAMVAAAIAQGATFIVAIAADLGFTGPITIFFVSLWLLSAMLFRRAARAP